MRNSVSRDHTEPQRSWPQTCRRGPFPFPSTPQPTAWPRRPCRPDPFSALWLGLCSERPVKGLLQHGVSCAAQRVSDPPRRSPYPSFLLFGHAVHDTDASPFVYPITCGRTFGFSQFLATVNQAAAKTLPQVPKGWFSFPQSLPEVGRLSRGQCARNASCPSGAKGLAARAPAGLGPPPRGARPPQAPSRRRGASAGPAPGRRPRLAGASAPHTRPARRPARRPRLPVSGPWRPGGMSGSATPPGAHAPPRVGRGLQGSGVCSGSSPPRRAAKRLRLSFTFLSREAPPPAGERPRGGPGPSGGTAGHTACEPGGRGPSGRGPPTPTYPASGRALKRTNGDDDARQPSASDPAQAPSCRPGRPSVTTCLMCGAGAGGVGARPLQRTAIPLGSICPRSLNIVS